MTLDFESTSKLKVSFFPVAAAERAVRRGFRETNDVRGHARRRQALLWTPLGLDLAAAAQSGAAITA
jgi:hypothetical protein